MNPNPTASDWAAERGEKWRANLSGMESMLAAVDEPLIRALQLDAPTRIADVACGGGGTTIEIRRRAPPGSVVHGFDVSPSLIEVARGRIGADDRAIAFHVADIATTTPARPYDRLVSRFGVMFFAEPQAAFSNLARWLAPGGRFAFAVWGPPSENVWLTSVRDVVARVVDVPPIASDAPGAFRYAEIDTLLDLLARAGFRGIDVTDWRGSLPIAGGRPPAEAAQFALASFGPFGELLAKAGQAALDEAQRLLTARFSQDFDQGSVRMDACVRIVTGTS
jgi:SAM-dependent methyltransferase